MLMVLEDHMLFRPLQAMLGLDIASIFFRVLHSFTSMT